jgi:hypothetical protein
MHMKKNGQRKEEDGDGDLNIWRSTNRGTRNTFKCMIESRQVNEERLYPNKTDGMRRRNVTICSAPNCLNKKEPSSSSFFLFIF